MLKYFVFLTFFVFNSSLFAARTIVVDKEGGDFTTVAEASKAAKEGDTVFIRSHSDILSTSGTFKTGMIYVSDGKNLESLSIQNQEGLIFRGFRFKTVMIDASQNIILEKCRVENGLVHISASSFVTLRDSTIIGKNATVEPAYGIFIGASEKVNILNNLIEGAPAMITGEVTLRGNTIVGSKYTGPSLNPDDLADTRKALLAGAALFLIPMPPPNHVFGLSPVTIEDNIIAFNQRGLVVESYDEKFGKKFKSKLVLRNNFWHANEQGNVILFFKKTSDSKFSYVIDDLLAVKNENVKYNRLEDPLFAGPEKGDYTLRPESPATRIKKNSSAQASSDVPVQGKASNSMKALQKTVQKLTDYDECIKSETRNIQKTAPEAQNERMKPPKRLPKIMVLAAYYKHRASCYKALGKLEEEKTDLTESNRLSDLLIQEGTAFVDPAGPPRKPLEVSGVMSFLFLEYLNRAHALHTQGNLSEAVENLDLSIKYEAESADALHQGLGGKRVANPAAAQLLETRARWKKELEAKETAKKP